MRIHTLLLVIFATATGFSQNKVLIISGGGSPAGNHYSQYLQTKTLFDHVAGQSPGKVDVYFGAGNRSGESPVLADVHRQLNASDGVREVMLPGFIDGNQSASKQNVLNYFDGNAARELGANDTFFLFVSDHGMPNQTADGTSHLEDNCIDLWGFNADLTTGQMQNANFENRCLSKNELKLQLEQKINAKQTVFAMSQCYSGGFHQMSVVEKAGYPSANPKVCGFTAITEDTTASGCTPDVDGPGYQGYERYFTQQLTGLDVVSGKKLRNAKKSIQEAHRAATLEDFTKDIPLATSDYYLLQWAQRIENSRNPRTNVITAQQAKEIYTRDSLVGENYQTDVAYRSKSAFFSRMQDEVIKAHPTLQASLTGSLDGLRAAELLAKNQENRDQQSIGQIAQTAQQYTNAIISGWNQFVLSGKSQLDPAEIELETRLFGAYDRQYGPGAGDQVSLYIMSIKSVVEPALSENISRYKAGRFNYALNWALAQPNLQQAAVRLKEMNARIEQLVAIAVASQKKHGLVRRMLLYRKALGSWNALVQMNDQEALNDLRGLLDCELASM